jgi:hypothetical protein
MDEAAGSMPATSIFCRTHIHTHTYIYVYIHIWCVCAFAKQKNSRRASKRSITSPRPACNTQPRRSTDYSTCKAWPGRLCAHGVLLLAWTHCVHLYAFASAACTICICTSPLCCGRDALCAWHAASGMRCVRIMHIISSPCAAGKCGEEKPDRYMYPKIAPLDVRYSLVGQDTALSPRRPGFDSRYRNSMWYFYHTGIRPCTDVV